MAKIITGGGVAEISGRMGGVVFSRCNSGPFVRNYVVPIQPATKKQLNQRSLFQKHISQWSKFDEAQYRAWKKCSYITFNAAGFARKLSGLALFLRVNANIEKTGYPMLYYPPADFSVPQKINYLQVDMSAGTGLPPYPRRIFFDMDVAEYFGDQYIMVYATKKISLGRNSARGSWRFIGCYAFNPGISTFLDIDYMSVYGQMSAADINNSKIFFKFAVINVTNGMMTKGNAGACIYGQTRKLV